MKILIVSLFATLAGGSISLAQEDLDFGQQMDKLIFEFFKAEGKDRFTYISPSYLEITANRPPDWDISLSGITKATDVIAQNCGEIQNSKGQDGWILGVKAVRDTGENVILVFHIVIENRELYIMPPQSSDRFSFDLIPWHLEIQSSDLE